MSPREANAEFLKVAMLHLQALQGGEWGMPTLADLSFAGRVHVLIERGVGSE